MADATSVGLADIHNVVDKSINVSCESSLLAPQWGLFVLRTAKLLKKSVL